jgi:formamidopyrimidine-DNA glycosylase
MPELPEVETMRRGVAVVAGSRIVAVERAKCRKRPISIVPRIDAFNRRLAGRTIVAVDRIGKRLVLRLDSGDAVIIEPRMTGLVLLADPPSREHLRLRIRLAGGPKRELLFWDRRGLGTVRLVTAEQLEDRYGLRRIGPDALAVTVEDLRDRLRSSRRAIKVALLDQKAVAGIGNLYASEILHLAGINPRRRCSALRGAEWERLHAAIGDVLNLAIQHEGSTLSDGTYRNALNQQGGFQNHHRVYDRAGTLCRRCGQGPILRIVQAQRSTFFCGRCQR